MYADSQMPWCGRTYIHTYIHTYTYAYYYYYYYYYLKDGSNGVDLIIL